MQKGTAESRIRNIQDLPTLPVVINQLVVMLENENTSVKELSELISKDQSILSVNLKLVNSAFYGYSKKITSIQQAIVILGFNTVKSMALGTSIFKSGGKRGGNDSFDTNGLWIHSLGVATASKLLAKKTGYRDAEEAFVAGLLHDVGKVIFDSFFGKEYRAVVRKVGTDDCLILKAERDVMNIDHAEAGRILLSKWRLPPGVTNAAGYHHDLGDCPELFAPLASIVHLADIICRRIEIGSGGDQQIPDIKPVALETLNCSESLLEDVMEETEKNKENIEVFEL